MIGPSPQKSHTSNTSIIEELVTFPFTWVLGGTHWEHTWELDGNMGPPSLHPQPSPKEGKNKRRRKVGPSLGHVGAHEISFLKLFVSGLPFLAWASSTPSMFYFRVVGYLTNLFTNLKHTR